jgi:inner membrane protein
VFEQKDGFQIGYRSVFDGTEPLALHFFPRNDSLLKPIWDHEEVIRLKKFSQGYYTVEKRADTLVFNDLRFGQMLGWKHPEAGFVFHYHLTHPEDNELVVQRGRFAGWNLHTPLDMINRIRGNYDVDR